MSELGLNVWTKSMQDCQNNVREDIEENKKIREIYSVVDWQFDHVYHFIDGDGFETWHKCVEINSVDEIFLKELGKEQYLDIYQDKKPELVKDVVLQHTTIINEGYQPNRNCI